MDITACSEWPKSSRFGNAKNTAARMEQKSLLREICVTEAYHDVHVIGDDEDIQMAGRKRCLSEDMGEVETYLLIPFTPTSTWNYQVAHAQMLATRKSRLPTLSPPERIFISVDSIALFRPHPLQDQIQRCHRIRLEQQRG